LATLGAGLSERFQAQVVAMGGVAVRAYRLAGRTLEVLCPERARLERWLAPLAPWALDAPRGTPDLRVRLFGLAAHDDALAGADPGLGTLLRQGEMVTSSGWCAHAHAEGGTLSLLDREAREACVVHAGRHPLPAWELAAPLRTVLAWWSEQEGARLVHAAGVGADGSGTLLVGAGGSGKSTTVLSCVAAGLETVGDDYLWLEHGVFPVVHALYAAAKVDAERLGAWFPAWRTAAEDARPGEKHVLALGAIPGARLVPRLEVASILLPHVSRAARPSLEPVSPAAALLALAPSSLFQLPGGRPEHLDLLVRLVRARPAFRLHLSLDPCANAQAVRKHLQERAIHARR
jgi:hypothetical protein